MLFVLWYIPTLLLCVLDCWCPADPGDVNFPVIVTSYEVVMADIKHLSKYHYKYIVVDEGHRLKNFECRLLRELRTLTTQNKLLLTGRDQTHLDC
jgi:SNF2 family DNA or RNA helicase